MMKATFKPGQEALDLVKDLRYAVRNFDKKANAIVGYAAKTYVRQLKQAVRKNELGLAPLAPSTIAKKGNDKILQETKDYVNGMQARKISEAVWGAEGDAKKADLHEYGTKFMPARPHWFPVLDLFDAKQDFSDALMGLLEGRDLLTKYKEGEELSASEEKQALSGLSGKRLGVAKAAGINSVERKALKEAKRQARELKGMSKRTAARAQKAQYNNWLKTLSKGQRKQVTAYSKYVRDVSKWQRSQARASKGRS